MQNSKLHNDSTAGAGYGFYTNSASSVCKNNEFVNIHTPGRADTLATTAAFLENEYSGNVGTISDAGTGTVSRGNIAV